jgi:TFIIF-interacting CTD phosphatase-like protein
MDMQRGCLEIPDLMYSSSDSVETGQNDPWDCDPYLLTTRDRIDVFLDLDHTLIAAGDNAYNNPDFFVKVDGRDMPVLVRPGLAHFLERLSLFGNWHIYTASHTDYAAQVMDEIDPDFMASGFYTREDCESLGPWRYRKRWEDTGVPFVEGRTFIVDDIPEYFGAFAGHGVRIAPFHGDSNDRELSRVLKEIYERSGG